MNLAFENAKNRIAQNVPPIWMMRQAGRYHSHYQALRAKHSFDQLCRTPELAAEVALGPIQDFDFDVSILFSDILYPLDALGLGLSYSDSGPKLERSLATESDVLKLTPWEEALQKMEFQGQALQCTRSVLPKNKSLVGFIGGLWTLFVYSVEGSHSGSLIESKKRISLFPKFLEKALPLMRANIQLQLNNGAEIVMVFDTAAGEVGPQFFQRHLAPVLMELANTFPGQLGYYSKGTQASFFTDSFVSLPWAGRGFDHRWDLGQVLRQSKSGFIQGNFDQGLLHLESSEFDQELELYIQNFRMIPAQERLGWVCGLGHGVLPKTPERNVRKFVDRVREALA